MSTDTDNDSAIQQEREEFIHDAVTALLDVVDEKMPHVKKSSGAFGDRLAYDLHKRLEQAFKEHDGDYDADMAEIARIKGKWAVPS